MNKRSRFVLILAVIALCFVFLWPSLVWYAGTPKEVQTLALSSLEKIKDYSSVMAAQDVNTLKEIQRADRTAVLGSEYAWLEKEAKKLYKKSGKTPSSPMTVREALLILSDETADPIKAAAEARVIFENRYRSQILKAKNRYSRAVKLGLDLSGGMSVIVKADLDAAVEAQKGSVSVDNEAAFREQAMTQAVETLRGRIDKFGLSEPVIRKQGEDRIYIEIPGAAETDRINTIILGKGILNIRLVDMEATSVFNQYYASHMADTFTASGKLLDPSIIPPDTEVLGLYSKDDYGLDERQGYLVIKKDIVLDGKHIKSATVGSGRLGRPEVHLTLDTEGAVIFGEFTANHVDDFLAIVSDDKVKSYARIKTAIPGGNVAIDGFGVEEAHNLQKVLQTAWLSVPLTVESQQTVGASLGEQTIRQGIKAVLLGLSLVLVFMLIWYTGAGINAVIAQILNLFMMFSILSAFGLTITLPSIAGMILTLGMAVDANVIIFERIRDELRLGKSRAAAVNAGFDRALWAVMDSNITTFIAALFLSQLGTGPIQGFAVSLAIGVFSSVFTALIVSRLIFDFGTQTLHREKINIGWGIKK
ncbi:protein translocase subunit SecD [Treponema sp. OMZ 840]|uniref:protein translocase subunit SecD n=1 Tax=Treponema sp. OMZ 840 TaxID=244313 RepID=UPI003D8CD64B